VQVERFQGGINRVSSERDIRDSGEENDVVSILENLGIRMEIMSDISEVNVEEERAKNKALGSTFIRDKSFQQGAIAN